MANDEHCVEQAREIFRTVRILKGYLTRRFHGRVEAAGGGCADITMPQSTALMVIQERGEVTVKELAEALLVSPPSASAMVERLVETGLVVREQSRVDRREVRVRLSGDGAAIIGAMEEQMLETITELLERVGPDVARQWIEVYARVREVLTSDDFGTKAAGVAAEFRNP